ncbi:MAG: DEAD/DEAH box helicase family protein [Desulfobacterales bacterium]|jgi:superfamily II DNA or RNA helicase|nr:DEAD/DEAH box helicase family protein [Desulfobacterales bacterium]
MLRKHQAEFSDIITRIISGSPIRRAILKATPGGGKSLIPIEACRLIAAGMADALCWVVPRQALQDQGERGFLDPKFRSMLGHRFTIRAATNDANPCRGTHGFITTYQALGVDTGKTVLNDFGRRRYILILDEFHHCEADGVWTKAIAPLVESAKFAVLMTGTLERGDGKQIAFIDYATNRAGLTPDLSTGSDTAVIEYTRADALAEQAILPIHFNMHDGAVEWMDNSGNRIKRDLSKTNRKDASAAIYTALATDYSKELLSSGISHWQNTMALTDSKCLIVTADISHARETVKTLRGHGIECEIATSHESAEAKKAIHKFKYTRCDCLVTIAMAYEGLDVPAISHLICLTRIRSTPWIEQMVARAVRVDPNAGPYENQIAHIFCPDDPLFLEIVKKIEREQAPFIKPKLEHEPRAKQLGLFGGDEFGPMAPGGITPIASSLTGSRGKFLGPVPSIAPVIPIQTEREKEEALRKQIDRHVKAYARNNRYKPLKINSELKDYFGKAREEMTRPELERLQAYLNQYYRLNSFRGHSAPVPTKAVRI